MRGKQSAVQAPETGPIHCLLQDDNLVTRVAGSHSQLAKGETSRLEYSTVLIGNVDFPTFLNKYPGLRHSNQGARSGAPYDLAIAFCNDLIHHHPAPPSGHTQLQRLYLPEGSTLRRIYSRTRCCRLGQTYSLDHRLAPLFGNRVVRPGQVPTVLQTYRSTTCGSFTRSPPSAATVSGPN
jgi:hypothetical protein